MPSDPLLEGEKPIKRDSMEPYLLTGRGREKERKGVSGTFSQLFLRAPESRMRTARCGEGGIERR